MPWLQSTAPYFEEVLLETNGNAEKMDVTVFNFENQLLNLLKDRNLFSDLHNLDVNPNNPFGKYKAKNDYLSTVNSGNRYQNAYKEMITSPDTEMLIPIIFAYDGTKVSIQGKYYQGYYFLLQAY